MKPKAIASSIYHADIRNNPRILVVGAGGTGSHLVHKLARVNQQLMAMTEKKLLVTVCDFDTVEAHNLGRQLFCPDDLGLNKATCLVQRVNDMYGLNWVAYPTAFSEAVSHECGQDLIIIAVDNLASRRKIILANHSCSIMDIGNGDYYGQVFISNHYDHKRCEVAHLYDIQNGVDIIDTIKDLNDDIVGERQSCSSVESLTRQSSMINDTMATVAANIVVNMLFCQVLDFDSVYVNMNGTCEVIPNKL